MKFLLNRFALTLKKDIIDNRRTLLIFSAVIMAFFLVSDTIVVLSNAHLRMSTINENLGELNVFLFILAASLPPSMAFRALGRKGSAAPLLMLPASEIEKYLSRWMLVVPCTLVLLLAVTCIGDVVSSFLGSLFYAVEYRGALGWMNYCRSSLDIPLFIVWTLFIQSFFFLGSLLWPRFSWGKSLIFLTLILILNVLVIFAIVVTTHIYSSKINILEKEHVIPGGLVLTVINYVIAYFRFREAEIINRW